MLETPLLTFVIACAPYHAEIVERAIASVGAQTIPCACRVVYDHDRLGAGWARNVGLASVETPFVSFLDADDWIEPTFAERCLLAYDGGRYVYTDWQLEDGGAVRAPSCAWDADGSWHILTALLPSAAVRHIGGFDEGMAGGEDTEFYWHLTRSGLCGQRLPEALFHYGKHGQRGRAHVASPNHEAWRLDIVRRYGDQPMACCVDEVMREDFSPGQAQPGDVLARWRYDGQRRRVGSATGRIYTKVGNSLEMWMNPADIDANPVDFERVVTLPPALDEAARAEFRALASRVLGTRERTVMIGENDGLNIPLTVYDTPTVPSPDLGGVLRRYGTSAARGAE